MPLGRRHGVFVFLLVLVACLGDEGAGPRPVPSALEIASSRVQTGMVAQPLDSALAVRVLDENGEPMAGVLVQFVLPSGAGSLSAAATTSDGEGLARSYWTLPTTVGTYLAYAKASGLDSLEFTAIATAAGPAQLELVSGDSQVALTGMLLDREVVVRLLDGFGNPAPRESLDFVPAAGSGSVYPTRAVTDVAGMVRVDWTMGALRGYDTLTVSAGASVQLLIGAEAHPRPADSVGAGSGHSCALLSGIAWCWGLNGNGQVATGDSSLAFAPVQTLGGNYHFLAASSFSTCGISGNPGSLYCWGAVDATQYQPTPLLIEPGTFFTHVSAGDHHLCAVTLEAAALCWGANEAGQLGRGTTVSDYTPAVVSGGLHFRLVTAGTAHTCGLTTNGWGYCWGDGSLGQLGTGNNAPALTPVAVTFPHHFIALSAGSSHTCALTLSGEAWCWGANGQGQLGDGTTTDRALPVRVAGGLRFSHLSAGRAQTCGVTLQGTGYCWGSNQYGRLGDGTTADRHVPTLVAGGRLYSQIATGGDHSCARATTGLIYCWGDNRDGQVGTASNFSWLPLLVDSAPAFTSLVGGGEHTCGLTSTGAAWCWGSNNNGELGDSSHTTRGAPVPVVGGHTFATLSAGHATTCGLTNLGDAWCWGAVGGNGYSEPFAVAPGIAFSSLSAGFFFLCGVTSVGEGVCWGSNANGQLGDSSTTDAAAPVTVAGGLTFTTIVAGANHACGLTTANEAWCWGIDNSLGIGSSAGQSFPAQVEGGHQFARLFTSATHDVTCGITALDEAWCWGAGSDGLAGNGSSGPVLTPVQIVGYSFANIGLGLNAACGATTDGQALCWGWNGYGQLGYRAIPYTISLPTPVQADLTVLSAAAYLTHSCALASDGRTYCWGQGSRGQLGTSQPPIFVTPFEVVIF